MQRRVIIIFGQTGSGKTTLAKKIIAHYKRVVIFDSQEEYEGFAVTSFEDFREYFTDEHREEFCVVCRYRDEIDYQLTSEAIPFIGNTLLVLEEAELYLTSWDRSNYLFPLISFGRHQKISLLAIGRRPSEIAAKLRSQCTSIFTFIQKEPRDLQFLEGWDFNSEAVRTLEKFQYATVGESFEAVTQTDA